MTYWPPVSPAVIRDRSLSPLTFRVYAALSMYADRDTGECYPGHETLAGDVGIAVRTVRKHVALLIEAGHVEISNRRRRNSVIYQITTQDRHAHAGQDEPRPEQPHLSSPIKTGTAAHQDRHGDDIKTGTAAPDTIKHPNEHIRKKRSDKNGLLAQDVIDRAAFEVLRLIGHENFEDPFIAQVAYLTATGAILMGHAIDAADAVREYRADNPVAYFRTVVTKAVGPGNLNKLLRCVPRSVKLTKPNRTSGIELGAKLRVVSVDEEVETEYLRNQVLDALEVAG